jgi:hypothetical protein
MAAGGDWEVRGLFGNEYALEQAVIEIKKMDKAPQFSVLDRRNLSVVLSKQDSETKRLVRNIITIAHGFVESDAPLGSFDKKKAELKAKKLKADEEKRKQRKTRVAQAQAQGQQH